MEVVEGKVSELEYRSTGYQKPKVQLTFFLPSLPSFLPSFLSFCLSHSLCLSVSLSLSLTLFFSFLSSIFLTKIIHIQGVHCGDLIYTYIG
jgi:hypothetical protein